MMRAADPQNAQVPDDPDQARHSARVRSLIGRTMRLRSAVRVRGENGQTLVEFAMVLPVLLIVLTGIFAFGIVMNQYEILTNAVSSGARIAAMSESAGKAVDPTGVYNGDPCAIAVEAVQSAITTLNSSNVTSTVTYTVKGNTTGTSYKYPTTCSGQAMQQGDTIKVVATYSVTPVMMNWTSGAIKLTAQANEFVQ